MLEELDGKKEEFKGSFALFNANNEKAQQLAIEKLKQNGIRNKRLQEKLDQLAMEEKNKKAKEEEEKRKKELGEED